MEPVSKSTATIERRGGRGRWWAMLLVALGVGAYLGWRTQNFGDPRYVGRWSVVQDYEGRMTTQIEFDANGSGRMYQLIDMHGENVEEPIQEFLWGVKDGTLLVDNSPNAGQLSVSDRVLLMINTWLYGQQPGWETLDYRVTEVGAGRLLLIGERDSNQEHFEIVKVEE